MLPLGVASVLWELECCAAQARVTLMNLNDGRPNHFGVFRAGVYVEEMRLLEEKVRFGWRCGLAPRLTVWSVVVRCRAV